MDLISSLQHLARVASPRDAVGNHECSYTFHSPYTSESGIVVSLSTFAGTVQELACVGNREEKEQQQQLFVRIVKRRVEKEKSKGDGGTEGGSPAAAAVLPTKLAIGVEGGFPTEEDKYETLSAHSVVILEPSSPDDDDEDDEALPPQVVAEVPYTDLTKDSFPSPVRESVDSVLCHSGALTQRDVASWQLDQEPVPASKYAEALPFVDNGVSIDPDPHSWRCQKTGDTDNLWLNLSTGYIGGGRRNWDGSGGSNGALDHYNETGQLYPLVVKLGTVTADLDTADCFSYAPDEDGPVKVPNLAELLQKRGINVAAMYVIDYVGAGITHSFSYLHSLHSSFLCRRQKTAKSTAELEVELNATYAFDAITESGSDLVPVTGPGLQGLQNLGNSCYINSVVQCLFSVEELANRYGTKPSAVLYRHPILRTVRAPDAPNDVLCQTTKVASALTSGAFCPASPQDAAAGDPKYRLAPRMFKHVVGKNHPEFRTGHQQDAEEFLRYFLEQLDRAELAASQQGRPGLAKAASTNEGSPSSSPHLSSLLFEFATEDRLVCAADQRVKYEKGSAERIWGLPIPMDKAVLPPVAMEEADGAEATERDVIQSPENKRLKSEDEDDNTNTNTSNKKAESDPVPTISFWRCVESWSEGTSDARKWPHLHNERHAASRQTRFANFPRYLVVQMLRYTVGPDWSPVKLEVNVDIPEEIDLEPYRSSGPVEGEDLVPDVVEGAETDASTTAAAAVPSSAPAIDEAALAQLMDMGFTLNSCKRALTAVGGSDVEAAMTWVREHSVVVRWKLVARSHDSLDLCLWQVFEHNMDPDFNDPLPEPSESQGGTGATDTGVDESVVQSLVDSLGCFTADQVRAALKETGGAADRAADWLFSHMDDLDAAVAALELKQRTGADVSNSSSSGAGSAPSRPLEDGPGKYVMRGMISHIGKNTGSGHYVAHVKKKAMESGIESESEDKWVIFNDEKVALSSSPPFPHAYLYLFQRKDTVGSPHPDY
jgi:ubiquitin carboxyl-terminal hydrolase 5/13